MGYMRNCFQGRKCSAILLSPRCIQLCFGKNYSFNFFGMLLIYIVANEFIQCKKISPIFESWTCVLVVPTSYWLKKENPGHHVFHSHGETSMLCYLWYHLRVSPFVVNMIRVGIFSNIAISGSVSPGDSNRFSTSCMHSPTSLMHSSIWKLILYCYFI